MFYKYLCYHIKIAYRRRKLYILKKHKYIMELNRLSIAVTDFCGSYSLSNPVFIKSSSIIKN